MSKNKIIKIIILISVIFVLFATIVVILFYNVRNNPVDKIAMPYIWDSNSIEEKYGTIESVSRFVVEKIEETDNNLSVPYSVQTDKYEVILRVNLIRSNDTWEAMSYEVEKVYSK